MKETTHTESTLLELLRGRYGGKEWVLVEKARDAAGFGASRTIDAIAFNVWPSRGLVLVGFELKVSRSDWLRELKAPEKAEVGHSLTDSWYVVAPREVVKIEELPKGWGLLEASAKRLTETRAAEQKPYTETVDRNLMAAMFKNMDGWYSETFRNVVPREEVERLAKERADDRIKSAREETQRLRERIERFEKQSGLSVESWEAGRVGNAVRTLLNGGRDRAVEEIQRTAEAHERLAKAARQGADEIRKLERPG